MTFLKEDQSLCKKSCRRFMVHHKTGIGKRLPSCKTLCIPTPRGNRVARLGNRSEIALLFYF